ncbi:MAG: terminase [Lachnospiraceae bacterium]|nr:terminase [Lachnospiraceae bacterium]
MADMLVLSPKFIDFILTETKRDFLEGTTAAGKTTVGIFKFMMMVAKSELKYHVIAGADNGTVEKNIINAERGLLEQFDGVAEYNSNGKGKIRLPHIEYDTPSGTKIIYIAGFDNKKRWQKVLGSQMGCVYIDEVNIADMEFMREITHRCKYMMTTSNPDSPDIPVYKEFINHSRPLKRYIADYPEELLSELCETPKVGWVHWYFTFRDNAALTEQDIQEKIDAVPVGTKMYKNKILGLRGKATGLVFSIFDRKIHCIPKSQAKQYIREARNQEEYFEVFTSGLDTAYSTKSPDTIAMSFGGITNKGKFILLDEKVYNNAELGVPIAPSDTVENYIAFLERNREEWGLAKNVFIDNADQATITELKKYKRNHATCIYVFNDAWKQTKIIDRINLQLGWMNFVIERDVMPSFYIVDSCNVYQKELDTYSWKEDKDQEPEDGNDHMVNSVQYAWLPYKTKIGVK